MMFRRTVIFCALGFASACGVDYCKDVPATVTCLSVEVESASGPSEVDRLDLWMDGAKKWASPAVRKTLPLGVPVSWPTDNKPHTIRLESYLSDSRNGVTNDLTLVVTANARGRATLKLGPIQAANSDMGTSGNADLSGDPPDLRSGIVDLR